MSDVTVSMPAALRAWVEARLAEGGYSDAAEYLRDLVRRDLAEASADRRWLKAMIDEGLASPIVEIEPEEMLDEIIAEDSDLRG
jgi:antitoxin ParD1/3/4